MITAMKRERGTSKHVVQAPGTRQRRPPWTLFRDGDDGEGNRLYDCTTVRLYDEAAALTCHQQTCFTVSGKSIGDSFSPRRHGTRQHSGPPRRTSPTGPRVRRPWRATQPRRAPQRCPRQRHCIVKREVIRELRQKHVQRVQRRLASSGVVPSTEPHTRVRRHKGPPRPESAPFRVNANIAHSGHNRAEPVRGDGRNTGENEDRNCPPIPTGAREPDVPHTYHSPWSPPEQASSASFTAASICSGLGAEATMTRRAWLLGVTRACRATRGFTTKAVCILLV